MLAILVEDYLETVGEGVDVPFVILAGVVAGEVGGGDVGDGFCVDVDDLVDARGQLADATEAENRG